MIENCIEWLQGDGMVCATLSSRKFINRLYTVKKSHENEVQIIENRDGTVCAHFPLKWLKINPTRELSEEQRKQIAERLGHGKQN